MKTTPKALTCIIVNIQDGDNFRFRNSQYKPVIFNSICVHGSLCTCDCAPCADLEGGRGVSRYTTPPPLLQIRNFMILGISFFLVFFFGLMSSVAPKFQFGPPLPGKNFWIRACAQFRVCIQSPFIINAFHILFSHRSPIALHSLIDTHRLLKVQVGTWNISRDVYGT